jgi:hypothetical protein
MKRNSLAIIMRILWPNPLRILPMHFDIIGEIENVEAIAVGSRIRELPRLEKMCRKEFKRKRYLD